MIAFGAVQIVLSQIPNSDQIKWLSIVVTSAMSVTYSGIGLGLAVAQTVASSGHAHRRRCWGGPHRDAKGLAHDTTMQGRYEQP